MPITRALKKKRNLLSRLPPDPDNCNGDPAREADRDAGRDVRYGRPGRRIHRAISVMYDWTVERNFVNETTARGIKFVYAKGKGATPWKEADVRK